MVLNRKFVLFAGVGLVSVGLFSRHVAPRAILKGDGVDWSYDEGALDGPDHWGELCEEFKDCAEEPFPSPINIQTRNIIETPNPPCKIGGYEYSKVPARVFDTGHGYQIDCKGLGHIRLVSDGAEKVFVLQQFHEHTPAEHLLNGKRADMELHFVHQAEDGQLCVIAVMVDEGRYNPELEKIVEGVNSGKVAENVSLSNLISLEHFYEYQGSLTTPPGTGNVQWIIQKKRIEASLSQIKALGAKYFGNVRPAQPLNNRPVYAF